ncbi:MAG TPA: DUF115 domain-containing protein [Candidatus Gastranaerophilales bacterium]|nr:DUF115 domain-containing protein [Candidatus Gastranaerophilales bacterium]
MTNNILDKNLQIISKYNKELAQKISGIYDLAGNFEIKEAKSGDSILFKNKKPVDDLSDPVWSSLEKFNKLQNKSVKGITVLYGLGLGYVLKEFAKRYKGKIIVYEPDVEILRLSLELVDFSEELKNPNIMFVNSVKDIENAYLVLFFADYKLNIVCSGYYLDNDFQELEKFKLKMEEIHGIYQSNYSNAIKKSLIWTASLLDNISKMVNNQDLHTLKSKFKGKTAVIISAGPSLDKNIEDLKPYRESIIVFCVGTALKTALKHGIIPDFAVAIETSPHIKLQLDVPEIGDINLITSTNVFKDVFNLKPKRFYNYHSNKTPAVKFFGQLLGVPVDIYDTAGTVSITSLYAAKMLGCDTIILIGQDLAYTDNKCYSQDTIYGSYKVDKSNKIDTEDAGKLGIDLGLSQNKIFSHTRFLNKNLCPIKGQNGEILVTRSDFFLFSKYFEEIAAKYASELRLVNSTEGGAYLEGFEHLPLKEAIEKYADKMPLVLENTLKNVKSDYKESKKRRKIALAAMSEVIKSYNSVKTVISETVNAFYITKLNEEDAESYKKFKNNISKRLELKKKNSTTSEEEAFLKEQQEKNRNIFINLEKHVENLFNSDEENVNLLKENYLKIKTTLEKDFFLQNLMLGQLLLTNNALKDLEPDNKDSVLDLFNSLSKVFIKMDSIYPVYIERIKKIIEQLKA